ncbi:AMP phosphorylase [Candidatus Pacearchaeota archaeon]|uniref:AMP phosphorylase n=1 Tax=uncultured Candidatus Pacearchaeota archaeon TaxID=2109283 RepID=A0A447IU44_9ARCH|nr:AMP phosphorylase [Candidatus Pacearchaeota archaeon]VDS11022.1 AMP phosphorylase [uncultured Candidatus Pacearchaeota archaeon]VDS11023.1 AMP phosphorylase [uncultured Candidatus Pacearchaeota archaeon]VDS11028.1 AMP phosphorylase [uncultured Candidatus Pacearchaeota archaeon]
MRLKIKKLRFLTGRPVCMIHEKTAKKMSLHVGNRVVIKNNHKNKIISIVDTVSGIIKPNEIAVSEEILEILALKDKEFVSVEITEHPKSISLIKKKLKGEKLEKHEINEIIKDIADNALTEVEVAFFISAVYTKGMSMKETKYLIKAMVESGNRINLNGKVVDKHCVGGIAGNRTTPIVVSICASTGLIMPKTSSRAITSAAGTADVIETIARVEFSIEEIKKIIKKTNACLVWGGALGLAPVDDKIIKIERLINIDSTPQLLASILSKKISVGSKYVLIDIPCGRSAKVSKKQAIHLKEKFIKLGIIFGLKMAVVLTDGTEPIGNGIGPILEVKDVIKVLKRENSPKDLEEKSVYLAGVILELVGKAKKGKGYEMAMEILNSGKAFEKFKQIINAQEGHLNHFKTPSFSLEIKAHKKLKILHFDNMIINKIARFAGCPEDQVAGIYLHKKKGDVVEKGETIFTIYTESEEKLHQAKNLYEKDKDKVIEFS